VSRSADACGSPDEARTRAAVQQRLAGELGPAASAIRVVVRGGVVTLTGMVDGEHERDRAEKLSYVVDGVEHVENHLRVRRPPENPRGM